MEELIKIGYVSRVHALKGEVNFIFTDDVWDRADADYLFVEIDSIPVPFFIEEYRFRSDSVALLKFQDVDSADDAQELVGCNVFFPVSLIPEEEPEELRWKQCTGFTVLQDGKELGVITSVDESTANVLLTIEGEDGEILVPAVEQFIVDFDYSGRTITMQIPEGLLNLNE